MSVNVVAFFDPDRTVQVQPVSLKGKRGALQLDGDEWVIMVNSNDPKCAQRFTVVHEGFHILRQIGRIHPQCRSRSATELLADRFAAAVLMPERWVRDRWRHLSVGLMARDFRVSEMALTRRLAELGLVQ